MKKIKLSYLREFSLQLHFFHCNVEVVSLSARQIGY